MVNKFRLLPSKLRMAIGLLTRTQAEIFTGCLIAMAVLGSAGRVAAAVDAAGASVVTIEQIKSLEAVGENGRMNVEANKKDVLLYFWATWCPDCKDKITKVIPTREVQEKFQVVLIATDKDKEKIEHFMKKNEVKLPVVIDANKTLQKNLGVFSVPSYVRLKDGGDKSFRVVKKQTGGLLENVLANESGTL